MNPPMVPACEGRRAQAAAIGDGDGIIERLSFDKGVRQRSDNEELARRAKEVQKDRRKQRGQQKGKGASHG